MIKLPPLPYPYEALKPVIGAETMHLHHDRHHAAYVEKTNALAGEAGFPHRPLEDIVRQAAQADSKPLFSNAAQAWNHAFFWESMTPQPQPPGGALAAAIASAYGGQAQLKEAFVKEGADHFASGWVWLAYEGGATKVVATHDADDTLPRPGVTPLLVCDLWEHAYYLDHKNDRKAFLEAWFDHLANWRFAEAQLAAASGQGAPYAYPA